MKKTSTLFQVESHDIDLLLSKLPLSTSCSHRPFCFLLSVRHIPHIRQIHQSVITRNIVLLQVLLATVTKLPATLLLSQSLFSNYSQNYSMLWTQGYPLNLLLVHHPKVTTKACALPSIWMHQWLKHKMQGLIGNGTITVASSTT